MDLTQYFMTQGPFAVLFVWLLFSSRKESKERETQILQESKEREKTLIEERQKLYDVLEKFSDKYDLVISKLNDIENKIGA